MAIASHASDNIEPSHSQDTDVFTDYGSDFTPGEESLLDDLLLTSSRIDNPNNDPDVQVRNIHNDETPQRVKLSRRYLDCEIGPQEATISIDPSGETDPGKDDRNQSDRLVERRASRSESEKSPAIEEPLDTAFERPDLRSPLERFRTKPRKPLTVTDLISPSWCELQYWYVLTKHGKKRRTPAMKQGSAVHKTLEDGVHPTFTVDITKKEDSWGLRIWNVIQGLRTLREKGITRELEVWATVDGIVVNGVIDELSYTCPDRALEATAEKVAPNNLQPAGQATITDFLGLHGTLEGNGASVAGGSYWAAVKKAEKIYLTDVKTRRVKTLPGRAAFRPTLWQLMIYHRLLSDLATDKVDRDIIFERYNLDPDTSFTDSFVTQIGSLDENIGDAAPKSSDPSQACASSTQDSLTLLLEHNSLRALWSRMIEEFAKTLPHGSQSIGRVLKAEYREPEKGEIMGSKTFLYDEKALNEYIASEMRWWRGERAPAGVCVEEAYKCGSCEFSEECSWKKNKIEDAVLKMRERKKSAV